jgi:parvulin-like peptidyl-prolyl isomerase
MLNQLLQQRSVIDREVIDTMIAEKLVRDEAAARDMTASEAEVNEFINRFLARQQGGLTAAAANETATARVEASATATLWTPTPTFTPSPTLTTTESITPTATPADTPTPAPTPTLNVLAEDALSTQYATWLGTLAEGTGISEADYRSIVQNLVLTDKLQEAIGSEAPTSAEQSHARHILVETEEEANDVVKRLEAGEDFGDLAAEMSTDTASADNGGDLGFVPKGSFVASVDEAVFNLPIGETSEPIESDFGWHVIEVLEREERELSPVQYERSQRQAYDDWVIEARAAAEIEDFWTPDKVPADPNNPLFQAQPQSLPGVPQEQ